MLASYPEGSKTRSALVTELTSKGLVPQSRSSIYRLLASYAAGNLNLDEDWKTKGQPKLFSDVDICEVIKDLETHSSKSMGENELVEHIRDKKKKQIEQNGFVPLSTTNYKPSLTSINKYKCLIVAQSKTISTSNTAVSKSNS